MKYIYSIIKADYLQRTRSYSFLITLAITIYAAYSFVPPPTASYTTLTIVGYKGIYNSAWVGYVSGMMTAIMLSMYGFFLVNGGIKKDIDTEVGLIIATTPITNFGYLLSKVLSNFMVLLTIASLTLLVNIGVFFLRTTGYPFIISTFLIPYLLFVVPALFFISSLAVVAEVFLKKGAMWQYIAFIFLFGVIMSNVTTAKSGQAVAFMDPFGIKTMTSSIENQISTQYHTTLTKGVNMGFIFNAKHNGVKPFEWNGITITGLFIISRLFWLAFPLALVYLSSFFFHRFDFRQSVGKKVKKLKNQPITDIQLPLPIEFNRALLPPVVTDYGIIPFIKTELLLLVRKGSKWVWLFVGGIWISMMFVPLNIAHAYILPILWFLQVTRWSELATKEETCRLHYFTYASYKPLQRMLPAQILAGVALAVILALPLVARYLVASNVYAVIDIIGGAVFIVVLAVCMGIVTQGKKLYEILLFLITYAIIEKVPVVDYMGAVKHNSHIGYMAIVLIINIFLLLISFIVRQYRSRHL